MGGSVRNAQSEKWPDHSDDHQEVVRVIEAETEAWLIGDIDEWKKYWKQTADAQHVSAWVSIGAQKLIGFEELERRYRPMLARIAKEHRPNTVLRNKNWRIVIGADMAWVTFDQILPIEPDTATASGLAHEMRVLQKLDGAWKIVGSVHVPNRYGYYLSPWVRVDKACRVVDTAPGLNEALDHHAALQIVGNRLCARSKADTSRLRNAVRTAAARIETPCDIPPTPLILTAEDGTALAPCWVTIADMMIVVLVHDDALLAENIARAGRAYHLSAKQVRVAELIAKGHDLSVCATKLGVQPSTVRTHVRRIFERVGVKSQPALVTALLSVASPG